VHVLFIRYEKTSAPIIQQPIQIATPLKCVESNPIGFKMIFLRLIHRKQNCIGLADDERSQKEKRNEDSTALFHTTRGRSYLKIEIFSHNFNVNFYGVGRKLVWENAGGDERKTLVEPDSQTIECSDSII
jgi:hypothetical protein